MSDGFDDLHHAIFNIALPILAAVIYVYSAITILRRKPEDTTPVQGGLFGRLIHWLHGALERIPLLRPLARFVMLVKDLAGKSTEISFRQAKNTYGCYSDDPVKRRNGRILFMLLNPYLVFHACVIATAFCMVAWVGLLILVFMLFAMMGEKKKYLVTTQDGREYVVEKSSLDTH